MNKENSYIINKFLLIGVTFISEIMPDTFMPEMHLWDPKAKKYSACGLFTKHKKRIDMFMKDGRLSHILKIDWMVLVFNMILLMPSIKID